MDEMPFLEYNSENNGITPSGALGEQVNTTKTWEELTQTLRGVAQELRTLLPDIKLQKNKIRGEHGNGVEHGGQGLWPYLGYRDEH